MESLTSYAALFTIAASLSFPASAQFGFPRKQPPPATQGVGGDLEIVTDSGEKFHLVHTTGPNFDVLAEASGQKIGTANTSTGDSTASGPDYEVTGAAMKRAKAAFLIPGHVHAFTPSAASVPQVAAANPERTPTPSPSVASKVLSYDAASGDATIQTADGPVKFTNKGDNFEVQTKYGQLNGQGGQTMVIHGHYVRSDNAAQKAKNGLKSLGMTMAGAGIASKQMYVGPAVELAVGAAGERNSVKSAYGMDGAAKDFGTVGGGAAYRNKQVFETVVGSVLQAAKAYETAAGQKIDYMPFLDSVSHQGSLASQ